MLEFVTVIAIALQATSAGSDHAAHMTKCAKVCADCQVTCDSCFAHCQMLSGKGEESHAKTAQYCVDCAECCKACASLCSRNSPLAHHMLECCAACCDDCAKSCESVSDDKQMADCARTCRDCAKECRDMTKMMDKG